MFLRMNSRKQAVVVAAVANVALEDGERKAFIDPKLLPAEKPNGRPDRNPQPRGNKAPKPLNNIITHIVRKYGANGRVRLPNCAGGKAFAKALQARGVQASV
jgi:hypothetical protein